MYHIDPLNGTLHRVFRNSDRKKLPLKCGKLLASNIVNLTAVVCIPGQFGTNKLPRWPSG